MADESLPIPDFDQLSLGDLRHRIRALDVDALTAVLTYEAGHAARVPVLEVLESRLRELHDGAQQRLVAPDGQRFLPAVVGDQPFALLPPDRQLQVAL